MLLRISDGLAILLCKIDLHTHRVYPRASPLGLTRFRSPFLIREDPDDLTNKDAAITALVTLASRIPSTKQQGHGAALQQWPSLGDSRIAQCSVLFNLSGRFPVDRAGPDLAIEGTVGKIDIAVDLPIGKTQFDSRDSAEDGVTIRNRCGDGRLKTVVLRLLGIDEDSRDRLSIPEAPLISEY